MTCPCGLEGRDGNRSGIGVPTACAGPRGARAGYLNLGQMGVSQGTPDARDDSGNGRARESPGSRRETLGSFWPSGGQGGRQRGRGGEQGRVDAETDVCLFQGSGGPRCQGRRWRGVAAAGRLRTAARGAAALSSNSSVQTMFFVRACPAAVRRSEAARILRSERRWARLSATYRCPCVKGLRRRSITHLLRVLP
eukprot:9503789-Pyramimonas_sp.AAC.3